MKVKKILSMLITACMLLSFIPVVSVSAETTTEWEYTVGVGISRMKNAECKQTNAITVKLKFADNSEESKFLENTGSKDSPATAKFKTTRAPWTLNGVELTNSSKDSLWMYTIWIKVSRVGSSAEAEYVLLHYTDDPKNTSSGKPIDQDDKGPASYSVSFDAKRQVWGTDNFMDALNKMYILNPLGESGTIATEWSGKIKDTYVSFFGGDAYDCMSLSDAPTMKVKVRGLKEDGSHVTKSVLEQNGVTFSDKNTGYNIDRAKLLQYMNANNMGEIHIDFTLEFPESSTKDKRTFSATTTIRRRAFCVDGVSYSRNYTVSYSDDSNVRANNRYYNNDSGSTVTATVNIKSTCQFAQYAYQFINKTVNIGEAYLTAGDGIKIPVNEKSVTTKGSKSFDLTFNLPDNVESGDAGLTLVIKDASLDMSGTKYVLWDSENKAKDLSHYTSIYKIDRKKPNFEIAPKAGVDLSKWHKAVTLYVTPSEKTYSFESNPQEGYATMYLYGNGTYPAVYKYNDTTQTNFSAASAFQKVPSMKGFTQEVTLALRGRVEGEYKLRFYGYDEAGNYFDSSYDGIKLDSKAPQISVTEKQEPQKSDGTKGNKYDVKISDASGTGRLYYMFTEKSRQDAPAFDENDVPKTSGDMDTTLDRWAYIEQQDTENGKTAAAYINVQKGENFNGRMLYFGMDEAGNKTNIYEKTINIQNENTAYDITPKDVDKPTPSYNITIDTNTNNTVYYRWKKAENNSYISNFTKYSGVIDTSKDEKTKNLNGVYTLECKIVPPSGTNIKYTSLNYVFDNEGPAINLTAPSAMSGKDTKTVSVYATDASDVASATGKIVNPDGTDIEGNEEFALNVSDGILSQNVTISDIPSGSYALMVTATDTNGKSKSQISEPFLIRNKAPEGSVNVKSDLSHNDKPLITSEAIELEFDISESFSNPPYAKDQALYYRIGTAAGEYGQWIKACDAELTDSAITAKAISAPQKISLVDGENTLFVQTAICNINDDLSKISQNTIKSDEVDFYYDETAPTADLDITDIQTKENIEGKLYVSDNLGGEIFISCESAAVTIGETEEGKADVTVSENTDTFIKVSDASGNETKVKLTICGIDKTPPTADIEVKGEAHGERKDAAATVKVNDVLGETVKFAFIPVDKYTDGAIPEEYFTSDAAHFKTSVTRSDTAEWDGENNITYKVQVIGTTGEWYLGVRSADSLGNVGEIVFTDNVLSAEDAALTQTTTPRLTRTESKTIVDTQYNVPVYTLPQDKILDAQSDAVINNTFEIEDFDTLSTEEKIEAANFELAKQYAMSYSDSYSFVASENGSFDLYTVDDLGRTNHLIATVSDVEFGAASDIKVTKYKKEWNEGTGSYDTIQVADNEFVCAMGSESYVIVESADPNDTDTLFMSVPELDGTNGLRFNEYESEACYDGEQLLGYSKLRYDIEMMFDSYESYTPSEATDRLLTVHAFTKGADYNDPGQVSEKTAVISNVDNTEPTVTWSSIPHVIDYKIVGSGDGLYEEAVYYPTPGNVTFTISGQDMETGIDSIIALEDYCCGEVYVPMTDANGAPTEYWSWDGNEHTQSYEEWDDEQGCYVEKYEKIPVKVEYFGDGDIYGVKTLKYTFTEAFRLNSSPQFINSLGAMGMMKDGVFDGGISTEEIIYKIPIEENTDFNVKYYYENAAGTWEEIQDIENTYYKNAKAVIDIPEEGRGFERGLYVSNNSGQTEKVLNNYQPEFTFKLKDKYGYTKDVPVSLNNFDIKPGEIDYTLETTDKTNKEYGITITVSDNEGGSGIGSVLLTSGGEEITLTEIAEGQYNGKISKNGTYSITLYDKVGNKTVKSFNVKNIDTVVPTASVTYSTEDYTSHPVSATLYFSKHNVRITNIEPVAPLTSQDYSVNYSTSTITFRKSGTVTAYFEDDYGNSGSEVVAVKNIDKTPPALEAVKDLMQDTNSVSVSFNKVDILTSAMDMARKESEIFVTYGGITKAVADENGNKNSFVFHQNGNYTFKVHDKVGLSSFLTLEITDIDTTAPKITSVSWSYEYDEFDVQSKTWVTKSANGTKTPTEGTVGYIVAPDIYSVTNRDINVKVETDSDTRLVGSSDDYTKTKEKVYDQNGLFIFNTEKKNGLVASYGVDIAIIDKTPPTIDLLGTSELVFYENPKMNSEYDISMLRYIQNGKYEAYKAYDEFNGKKTDLTENVEIDWGGFNPNDLNQNTFDSSKPYTITYRVTDSAHNTFEAKRTVRLVGLYDTVALVNGNLPDFAGRCAVKGDNISISLSNFAGTAYVRYQSGIYTMGQMKNLGTMLSKSENGEFETPNLPEGWYTFYIQTDKRDYFTLCVYLSK